MKSSTLMFVFLAMFLVATCVPEPQSPTPSAALTLAEALDYRKLTALHDVLRDVESETMMLCIGGDVRHGPHVQEGIRTYANQIAITHDLKSDFPVGSVLIKEKFSEADIPSWERLTKGKKAKLGPPDYLTTMKKILPGSGADKWHYMLVDLKRKKVLKEYFRNSIGGIHRKAEGPGPRYTSMSDCMSCHTGFNKSFYISPAGLQLLREYRAISRIK